MWLKGAAIMDRNEIKSFLHYPDAPLVELAVKRANLDAHELRAIKIREYDNMTVEAAAEYLRVSPGTIKNEYRSAMHKLDECWTGVPWIRSLVKTQHLPQ